MCDGVGGLRLGRTALTQAGGDLIPFRSEFAAVRRFSGAAIPIAGVRKIAFYAVQIGVYPIARITLGRLGQFMRPIPIALRREPQSLEGQIVDFGRGRGAGD